MTVQAKRFFEIHDESSGARRTAVVFFHEMGAAEFASSLRDTFDQILKEGYGFIILDLRQINSCDSVTLGMFVGLNATARHRNAELEFILRRGSHVRRMFSILSLEKVLNVQEIDTAVAPQWADESNS